MDALQYIKRALFPPSTNKRRLTDKMPQLLIEINTYKRLAGASLEKKPWLIAADEEYKLLEDAVKKYEIQQGWKIYKNIKQLLIYEKSDKSRISFARSVFNEATTKMAAGSWRQKSITELLGKPEAGAKPDSPEKWVFNEASSTENIIRASEILDEYQDNFYERYTVLRSRISRLSMLAFIAIVLFIVIGPKVGNFPPHADLTAQQKAELLKFVQEARREDSALADSTAVKTVDKNTALPGQDDSTGLKKPEAAVSGDSTKEEKLEQDTNNPPLKTHNLAPKKEKKAKKEDPKPINERPRMLAFLVVLMGFIGAITSGFLRFIQGGTNPSSIPLELFGNTILSARLVLATVASLTMYVFLGTGILLLFSTPISFELLLSFAFAAGFSEQLVQKGVEALTKEEMYKGVSKK